MSTDPILHQPNGTFIDEGLWNELVDGINANTDSGTAINTQLGKNTAQGGINDIATRLSTMDTKNTTQDTNITALQTTVNATGTTAAGNAALSSRLGTGITTSSTATAQLATKAAASDLTALGTRMTTAEGKLGTGMGTNDNLSAGSGTSGTIGSQLRYLQANIGSGGGATYGPLCVVYATTQQSVASGTFQAILMNQTRIDTDGSMHSTSTNTSRIVVPEDGIYLISGVVCFTTGSATGVRAVELRINGTEVSGSANTLNSAPAANVTDVSTPAVMVQMTAGQYVELFGYQTTGSAFQTHASTPHNSTLSVSYLRPGV